MIRRSTWIILLLFVAVLAGTLLWNKYKPEKEVESTPTVENGALFKIEPGKIVRFEIKKLTGEIMAAKVDAAGMWQVEGYTTEETDSNQVQSILQQLSGLTILSTFEQSPGADLVGLGDPAYVVTVDLQDGSREVAYIGNPTPTSSGYYARLESGNILVVNKYQVDTLIGILDTPPLLPTPTPTENVTLAPEETIPSTPTP